MALNCQSPGGTGSHPSTSEDKTAAQAGRVAALEEKMLAAGNSAIRPGTMAALDENYYKKIEQYWLKDAGKRFGMNGQISLSPFEIDLIEELDRRLVPLKIVKQGIDLAVSTYLRNYGRAEQPALAYCRRAILRRYREWSQAQVGKRLDEIKRV